jgi:hypothetical protein
MVEKMTIGNYYQNKYIRIMVSLKDIDIHLFVQEAREEVDLEYKWYNAATDEEVMEMEKIALRKHKRAVYEPLYDEN